MKKTNMILLVAAGAMLASGGGSTITREQAKENLANSAKYVESDSFKSPTKCTSTSVTTTGDDTVNAEVAYDLDNTYLRSILKSSETNLYAWVYADGDKYVNVLSTDGTTGTYSYIEKTEAEAAIKVLIGEIDLSELFEGLSESLSVTIKEVESQEASASVSIPGYTIEKNEFKESYTSTGDGNLTMNLSYEFAGTLEVSVLGVTTTSKQSISTSLSATVDKYLPKSIKSSNVIKMGEGDSALNMDFSEEQTFDWGSCDLSKPDLSKFTKNNEGKA